MLDEKIVAKALIKAKLFEDIPKDPNEIDEYLQSIPSFAPHRPPVKVRQGCQLYSDNDFYLFVVLTLFYYECGFVVRQLEEEDEKIEKIQIIRELVKNARIPIQAAFAKLHIGARVPTIGKMLTDEERLKMANDEKAEEREGLLSLFLPDEFSDAQIYLCDTIGDVLVPERESTNLSIIEEGNDLDNDKIVSLFSRQIEDTKPKVESLLKKEKTFRYGLVLPCDHFPREKLMETIFYEKRQRQPTFLSEKLNTILSDSGRSPQPTEGRNSISEFQEHTRASISKESSKDLAKEPSKELTKEPSKEPSKELSKEATGTSLITDNQFHPPNPHFYYRCQDRFSAFALYASVNFLPTAHTGQTTAPIPVANGADPEVVPVSLVVTGLTSPNQLSGLVRICHYIRLSGVLPLGKLESVFVYGLEAMSRTAKERLAEIQAEKATTDAINNLELIDESFLSCTPGDEKFQNVNVALVFGDILTDSELVDDSPNIFNDQMMLYNHPMLKTRTNAIVDAVCYGGESSCLVWYSAVPSRVLPKPKEPEPQSPTMSDASKGRKQSRASDEEEEELLKASMLKEQRGGKKKDKEGGKKGEKKGEKEEKKAGSKKDKEKDSKDEKKGKATLEAPSTNVKGGKKSNQPEKLDKAFHKGSMDDSKRGSNVTDRIRNSVFSPVSNGRLSNASVVPQHFSTVMKPNSMTQKIYQSAIHAAKSNFLNTVVNILNVALLLQCQKCRMLLSLLEMLQVLPLASHSFNLWLKISTRWFYTRHLQRPSPEHRFIKLKTYLMNMVKKTLRNRQVWCKSKPLDLPILIAIIRKKKH